MEKITLSAFRSAFGKSARIERVKNQNAVIVTLADGEKYIRALYSYGDLQCWSEGQEVFKSRVAWNQISVTTARHIRNFCALNKKEFEGMESSATPVGLVSRIR